MARVQLALNVDDLDAAITFYAKLFNTEPVKVKPGYANFAVAEPPLKLVLLENPGHGGALNHLGVEVATSDAVHAEIARLTDEGLFTEEELNTTCCFAAQDKVWITGPSGERWEVYTVLADSDTFGPNTGQPDETCCPAQPPPASLTGCGSPSASNRSPSSQAPDAGDRCELAATSTLHRLPLSSGELA